MKNKPYKTAEEIREEGMNMPKETVTRFGKEWTRIAHTKEQELLAYMDMDSEEISPEERSKVTKELIKEGAEMRITNSKGATLLHMAAILGDVELIELCLKEGLEVNFGDMFGATPLHVAVLNENFEIAKLLIDRGADTSLLDKNGNSPLDAEQIRKNV